MDYKRNSSRVLAQWIADFQIETCKPADLDAVRLRLLDYILSACAGWTENQAYNQAVTSMFLAAGGSPESSLLFSEKRLPAPAAAYLNATYGHGADMDDGHRRANGHPGVAVIPAVLALAEARGKGEADILAGILVGYETYVRLSMAVQPSLLRRGFHGTGVVGAVAASAACARVLKLDARKVHNAISLGAVQASGLFEVSESGQTVKPVNPANACRTGVESAVLAEMGVEAPENPLEGAKGFYHAFADETRPQALTEALGDTLAIHGCYIKLSPACCHTHPSIDAGTVLGRRNRIDPERIAAIDLYTYPNAAFVTGKIALPENSAQGKFSMRYALAMALQRGCYSFRELKDTACISSQTRALVEKIRIIPEEAYECPEKGIRGGRVVIHFTDGTRDSYSVTVPKGDPENPLDTQDMLGKMTACCAAVLSPQRQRQLYDCVMTPGLKLEELMALCREAEKG